MKMTVAVPFAVITLCAGLAGCERQVSFADDVEPILDTYCIECHDQNAEGYEASGFSLRDYEDVMKGTKFGPVVVPGSAISSVLYLVVAQKTAPEIQMPPHHAESLAKGRGEALQEDQVEVIRAWIDQGAKNN
jgi:Planctomycete cytochrome C